MSNRDLEAAADNNEDNSGEFSQSFKKRLKALLKEPENQRCSECWSKKQKPKFVAIFKVIPIKSEDKQLGVFCCKRCKEHHAAMGPEMCTIKSLKEPESWNESDIEILEGSGNKVVNTIYLASMQGNHTEKHMGSLASAAFVESKYKNYLFFSEEIYHEQMNLVAMMQFAKDMKPVERAAPTAEDKLRTALKKQKFMSVRGGGFGPDNDLAGEDLDKEKGIVGNAPPLSPPRAQFANFDSFDEKEEGGKEEKENGVNDENNNNNNDVRNNPLRDSTGLSMSRHGSRRQTMAQQRGRSPTVLDRSKSRKSLSPQPRAGRISDPAKSLARPGIVQRATSAPNSSRSRSPAAGRGLSRDPSSRWLMGGGGGGADPTAQRTSSSHDLRSSRSRSPNGRGTMSRGNSPGRGRGMSRERSSRWLLGGGSPPQKQQQQQPSNSSSPAAAGGTTTTKRGGSEKSLRKSRSLNREGGTRNVAMSTSPPRSQLVRKSGSSSNKRSNSHSPTRRNNNRSPHPGMPTKKVPSKSRVDDTTNDESDDSSLDVSAPGSLFDDDSVSDTSLNTSESSQQLGTANKTTTTSSSSSTRREDVILRAVQARQEAKQSQNAMLSSSLHRAPRDLSPPRLQSTASWGGGAAGSPSSSSPGPSSAAERRQMILDNVLSKEPGEGKSIPRLLQSSQSSSGNGSKSPSRSKLSRSRSSSRGSPPPSSGVGRRQMMTMMIQDSAKEQTSSSTTTTTKKSSSSSRSNMNATAMSSTGSLPPPSAAVEKRQFILDEVMSEDPFKGI